MDLRARFSLGRGLRPPRDPLGPAAFGYLSGSYSILLRSRSLGAAGRRRRTCGRYTAGPRQRYGAGALPGANRAQAPDAISGACPRGGDPSLLHRRTATGAHGSARGENPLPLQGPRARRDTSPRRMLEQRVLRATSWKDFTEEEVAVQLCGTR